MKPPDAEGIEAKPLTIGAVVELLKPEFTDISISKIRFLEEEKLISPRRTPGGYRLFSKPDIERLRTILTLQRDEFMPLKVIRREMSRKGTVAVGPMASRGFKKISLKQSDQTEKKYSLQEALETSGADPELVREMEDYGLIAGSPAGKTKQYDQTDVEVMAAAASLARYGVEPRNLKTLKSSVDRELSLLMQIMSPALKSQNPETRSKGIATLESLATVSAYLKHLLLIKDLRELTAG